MLPPPPFKILDGSNSSSRTRPYYFRSCKRATCSMDILDDMLSEILLRLPTRDIYFGARLVCRKWYNITRSKYFIHKRLEQTSYGLLYRNKSGKVVFISAREDGDGIDTCRLNYNYKIRNSFWLSWDGLMLESKTVKRSLKFYVKNVSTKQDFILPPCLYDIDYVFGCGIGYDATSMTYKVVAPHRLPSGRLVVRILTLGVDISWRIIDVHHLYDLGMYALMSSPVVTEGFLHWKMYESTDVVTLNLSTEEISETSPNVIPNYKQHTTTEVLSTGRYLSLFVQRQKYLWEVFEMNPKTGRWRDMANICLEGQMGKIHSLGYKQGSDITPCGWLKYPDMLALRVESDYLIFYNPISCEIIQAKRMPILNPLFTLHKNTSWMFPEYHYDSII